MPRVLRKNAFTFLEIVAALAVLAIGIVAILAMFPVGLRSGQRSAERTRASLLVYSDLQKFRARGFVYATGTAYAPETPFPADPYFVRIVRVNNPYAGASPGAQVAEVIMTAQWPSTESDAAKRKALSISTLIAAR